ncbi:MAG: hypothetical protein LKK36_08190 [Ewingella americana]|jgi:hypothetical protein|uniref:hypothetical protein n=1 Tax=Ewingella americana TaxID=41202 RepID=UPI002431188D|nr:hypothetical protein [Ewingella americana]MCI1678475.1 hypothetical protein [Ewingella americana]MCI1854062.1 hypothetical protein [Ewingella americana]MCI1861362.1 hypothetical protein [Ewingella americana]MCI2143479.1 hypothetical protein [Ewingella americana]MCI2163655.1 hypothetical protein [Ewingella americana]
MDNDLEIVFVPPLITLLVAAQNHKGSALTQTEVEEIRDNAVCIALPSGSNSEMAAQRGYHDIDPDSVWSEYLGYINA